MKNFDLYIRMKDDKIGIDGGGQKVTAEQLLYAVGYLQTLCCEMLLKMGVDMEDAKNEMLDMHLAAMRAVEDREDT